jgi:hypothetical protein
MYNLIIGDHYFSSVPLKVTFGEDDNQQIVVRRHHSRLAISRTKFFATINDSISL